MKSKIFGVLLSLLLIAGLVAGGAYWRYQSALTQPLVLSGERLLEVPAGATPNGMLNSLEADGTLTGAFWLRLHWRLNFAEQGLKVGDYRLQQGQTATDLLNTWLRGEVIQYRLTLVEGWNFRQVRAALAAAPRLEQTLAGLDDAALMQRLGLEGQPEGRFFPDTYQYVRGMRDVDLLRQSHERLERVLKEAWAKRAEGLPYQTPYQALVMASLIEKETGLARERPEIAGVFIRRLQKNMLLQTDPAVIYGLGEQYKGNLTREHLRTPTPYNTYTQAGLPPTPIALVGREAIEAALHPAEGESLYFVARGDGSHTFSRTLDEHNRAVRDYQLKRREGYRSSPASTDEVTRP